MLESLSKHLGIKALRSLPGDGILLFVTRFIRLFAYGFLGVILVLYLSELKLSDEKIGIKKTTSLIFYTSQDIYYK